MSVVVKYPLFEGVIYKGSTVFYYELAILKVDTKWSVDIIKFCIWYRSSEVIRSYDYLLLV